MTSTTVLLFYYLGGSGTVKHFIILLMTYSLSFLMVSNVRYSSFKDLEPFKRKSFHSLVVAVLLLTLVAALPHVMLFTMMLVYVAAGPVNVVRSLRTAKSRTVEEAARNKKAALNRPTVD